MNETSAEVGRRNILANKLVDVWECSFGLRGVIISILDKTIKLDVQDRKESEVLRRFIFGYLFSDVLGLKQGEAISSKQLTDVCWYALYAWILPVKDQETGVWRSDNINFQRELFILLDESKRMREEARQKEMELLGQLGFDI